MCDARFNFIIRTMMMDCKINFKNTPENFETQWKCDSCMTCIDMQNHILYCTACKEGPFGWTWLLRRVQWEERDLYV